MVEVDNMRVMDVLSHATNTIAKGEVQQLLNCHDPETSEERYLEVIRNKTAKLFEVAALLGAVISGSDAGIESAMAAYGMHPGRRSSSLTTPSTMAATIRRSARTSATTWQRASRRCP